MAGMMQAVRKSRNMPFLKRGMRCDMNGKRGIVTSATGTGLMVKFDGDWFPRPVHPKSQMTYYAEDGSVIMDYKQAK